MPGQPVRDPFAAWGDRFGAQASGQVAGIDAHWTGGGAQPVYGAGVYPSVGIIIYNGIKSG